MSEADQEKVKVADAAPAKKKGLPSMVWLGGLAAVIIAAAYMAVEFVFPASTPSTQHEVEKPKPQPKMFRDVHTLPAMLVNLAGSGGKRYLKIGIAVEYEASDVEVIKKRFEERKPSIQDRLIEVLSALTLEKINDPENKTRLKEMVSKDLTKIVFEDDTPLSARPVEARGEGEHEKSAAKASSDEPVAGHVSKILFTDFVVQ
ncbi:MAG: flagellar basal body-associated FliL family protein [Planctomycetes bacterium]|nr:flagellar basal body-associated FliL family protein [Planctomycetota bacterium]MBI3843030.1 flagellar basal body-associated FliL family protein [Planctomycetota bacterium]